MLLPVDNLLLVLVLWGRKKSGKPEKKKERRSSTCECLLSTETSDWDSTKTRLDYWQTYELE
eukprot:snap_masked-scaffold_24-processed-gene-1.7-mRNA-1 protein AED:1.00 eAED:1.00 QI:0/0/0/0/1/1/2/0/61